MTTVLDIWNQALSEVGGRAVISSQTEKSKEAQTCAMHWDNIRQTTIRLAPWNCARFQTSLDVVESVDDVPPTNQWPWNYSYSYPADCLQVRYILPPAPASGRSWRPPSRNNRFLPALDSSGTQKVILASLNNAIGVYSKDLTDPNLWDASLNDAIVSGLCAKLAIPIAGNVQMKGTFEQLAEAAITAARVVDANETLPQQNPMPDWLAVRGGGCDYAGAGPDGGRLGYWYTPYFGCETNSSWGE